MKKKRIAWKSGENREVKQQAKVSTLEKERESKYFTGTGKQRNRFR